MNPSKQVLAAPPVWSACPLLVLLNLVCVSTDELDDREGGYPGEAAIFPSTKRGHITYSSFGSQKKFWEILRSRTFLFLWVTCV